ALQPPRQRVRVQPPLLLASPPLLLPFLPLLPLLPVLPPVPRGLAEVRPQVGIAIHGLVRAVPVHRHAQQQRQVSVARPPMGGQRGVG
ncbi:unnamed protein product, partial [Closterium sp. NIES-53]